MTDLKKQPSSRLQWRPLILKKKDSFLMLTNPFVVFFPCRYGATRAVVVAITCTFFEFFNIPVFWPILVMYFIVLFVITMKRQIKVSKKDWHAQKQYLTNKQMKVSATMELNHM